MLRIPVVVAAATALACVAAHCATPSASSLRAARAVSRERVQTMLSRVTEGYRNADADLLRSVYADPPNVALFGSGYAVQSRNELKSLFRASLSLGDDLRMAPARVWITGDVAIVEWAMKARPARDGAPRDKHFLDVDWFDESGQIREQHVYGDRSDPVRDLPPAPEVFVGAKLPSETAQNDHASALAYALNTHDPGVAAAAFEEDAELWTNVDGATVTGRVAISELFADALRAVPDQHWRVTDGWGIGPFAVILGTVAGTWKAKLAAPAVDTAFRECHVALIASFQPGRPIGHAWVYVVRHELERQLYGVP